MLRGIPSPTPRSRHAIRLRKRIQLSEVELRALRAVQQLSNSVTRLPRPIGFEAHIRDWSVSSINLSISSTVHQGHIQRHYIHVVSPSVHLHHPRPSVLICWTQDHRKATAIDHSPPANQSHISGAPSHGDHGQARLLQYEPGRN